MSSRAVALVLTAAALLLHFGFAEPTRRRAAAAVDEFGRARHERREALVRVAALERRNRARAEAVAAVQGQPADPEAASRTVRRSVARALEESRAAGVQLTIRPEGGRVDVNVSARGPAASMVELAGRLARPDVGVVLERVQITRAAGDVQLQLFGAGVAGRR